MTDFNGSAFAEASVDKSDADGVSTGGRSVGTGAGETASTGGSGFASASTGGLTSAVNPKTVSNSVLVNPFRTAIVPSSFSTRVTGVPAKLLEIANISVKNSLLVSKSFSSKTSLLVFKYSFSCLENAQSF